MYVCGITPYDATHLGHAATYVAFDLVSEAKLKAGTLTGMLADAHSVIDHLIPVLAGALIGLSVYHLRLRARLAAAEEAAGRAEALRVRLLKVERDQAVWVLAAAVLHELNNPLHALGLLLEGNMEHAMMKIHAKPPRPKPPVVAVPKEGS